MTVILKCDVSDKNLIVNGAAIMKVGSTVRTIRGNMTLH